MAAHGRAAEAIDVMNRVRDAYGAYVGEMFFGKDELVPKPSYSALRALEPVKLTYPIAFSSYSTRVTYAA